MKSYLIWTYFQDYQETSLFTESQVHYLYMFNIWILMDQFLCILVLHCFNEKVSDTFIMKLTSFSGLLLSGNILFPTELEENFFYA